jgi:hypothetical protein
VKHEKSEIDKHAYLRGQARQPVVHEQQRLEVGKLADPWQVRQ